MAGRSRARYDRGVSYRRVADRRPFVPTDTRQGGPAIRRVLLVAHAHYLDAAGPARAGRALLRLLKGRGFAVEAITGSVVQDGGEVDPAAWLQGRGLDFEVRGEGDGTHFHLDDDGIPVTIHRGPTSRPHDPNRAEAQAFLRLLEEAVNRVRPDVLLVHADCLALRDVLAAARGRGIATLVLPTDDPFRIPPDAALADAALAPTKFVAEACREAFALTSATMPAPIDVERARAGTHEPRYVTFVDPTTDGGAYPFTRIADELGRRRPDIPLLVVEGRGTEATLGACGIDLRAHGNVHVMAPTTNPRSYWGLTRVALMPSLGWEGQPQAAVEALVNGIPAIASDRGGLAEVVGEAGAVLSLPLRLTPATCTLPTPEEVTPWVDAVIRLWDDPAAWDDLHHKAEARARRWESEALGPRYARLFEEIRPRPGPPPAPPPGRTKCWVLVPHLNGVEWACERSLRVLEHSGVRVVRREGSSAIDVARNMLASEALHGGAEAILFIDADVGFHPPDALRLLARPEPVVAGVYAKKGQRAMASTFPRGLPEIVFGSRAPGLYPLQYAATGFLRIKADVLRRMADVLALPLCNTAWGKGVWPFFQPTIVPHPDGGLHYLAEDWAFSHRLAQIGVVPLADTSIRLLHYGRYGYTWEDAGSDPARFRSFTFRMAGPPGDPSASVSAPSRGPLAPGP